MLHEIDKATLSICDHCFREYCPCCEELNDFFECPECGCFICADCPPVCCQEEDLESFE